MAGCQVSRSTQRRRGFVWVTLGSVVARPTYLSLHLHPARHFSMQAFVTVRSLFILRGSYLHRRGYWAILMPAPLGLCRACLRDAVMAIQAAACENETVLARTLDLVTQIKRDRAYVQETTILHGKYI